jgi:hypothetical protein
LDLESSPAYWFVWMMNPGKFRRYGGYGFSTIAEAYLNFGYAGVVVFFLGLGFVLAWMEQVATRSAFALAGVTVVLAPLLWTVRNDFSVFTRAAVWGLAFVAIAWVYCKAVVRRDAPAPKPVQGSALGGSKRQVGQVATSRNGGEETAGG